MRFAYADPPYPGMAHFYEENTEVDHGDLIRDLCADFPDGWALSTASTTLSIVLPLCPDDVRVMAWVKPFASFKPGVGVAYAWEPIIVRGGRRRTREQGTVRDWVAANITLQRGMVGVKPEDFCFWLFEVLNIQDGDELVDVFPGSGAVTAALEKWRAEGVEWWDLRKRQRSLWDDPPTLALG